MAETKLSELLEAIETPEGRRRLAEYLESQPYPHYEAAPGQPEMLVRIEADGRRTLGRFVGREWKAQDHHSNER